MERRSVAAIFFSVVLASSVLGAGLLCVGAYQLFVRDLATPIGQTEYVGFYPPTMTPEEAARQEALERPKEAVDQFWINGDGEICTNADGEPILCETGPCTEGDCTGCDPAAYQFQVTFSTFVPGDPGLPQCATCGDLNDTITLTNTSDCLWTWEESTACGTPPNNEIDLFRIELQRSTTFTSLTVYVRRDGVLTSIASWTELVEWDCASELTLDDTMSEVTVSCDGAPASVTVTPL